MILSRNKVHFFNIHRLSYSSFSSYRRTEAIELFSELNPEGHQCVCLVSMCAPECWPSKHITVTCHIDTLLQIVPGPSLICKQQKIQLKAAKSEENMFYLLSEWTNMCVIRSEGSERRKWSAHGSWVTWCLLFSQLDKPSSVWQLATAITAGAH